MEFFLLFVVIIAVSIWKRKLLKKHVRGISDSYRYDNFGFNFDLKKVVEKELKKFDKPPGTLFKWETDSTKRIINIELLSTLDDEKTVSDSVSLKKPNRYHRFSPETYDQAWAKGTDHLRSDSYMESVVYSIKVLVQGDIRDTASHMISSYKIKFPPEFAAEEKFGII